MKPKSRKSPRMADLARIHILKKDLKLDDESYRNVLFVVAGGESAKMLDDTSRQAVIRHLESHLERQKTTRSTYRGRPRNIDAKYRKELRKIEAYLADAGRSWDYALAIVKQMYGNRPIEWLDSTELSALIAALDKEARKRLQSALTERLTALGWSWAQARHVAIGLYLLPPRWSLESNAQAMSELIRWLDGRLDPAPYCAWPR